MNGARSSSATGTTGTADAPATRCGRFAPTPSGPLHFGSIVAAVGSYVDARARGGLWRLRIEDLDPPRVRHGAADAILRELERLGLHWDGEVLYQGTRIDAYAAAFERLLAAGRLRPCGCSRAALAALPANRERPPGEELHHPPECLAEPASTREPAWRMRTADATVDWLDRVQGRQCSLLADLGGDFVVQRRDGLYAYQLASVVDDAAQGVTDVVRGVDLLTSTPRQLLLIGALGLRRPDYMHLPLAVDASGVKLSKSGDAPASRSCRPATTVVAALEFLQQAPPRELARGPLEDAWHWALAHWRPSRLEGLRALPARAADHA